MDRRGFLSGLAAIAGSLALGGKEKKNAEPSPHFTLKGSWKDPKPSSEPKQAWMKFYHNGTAYSFPVFK